MADDPCKLFFALRPPPKMATELDRLRADIRRRMGLTGRAAPQRRLHVSLASLGAHAAIPEPLVRRAADAVSGLHAPAFALAFNRLGTWGRGAGARPVVLWGDDGVIGAELLHGTLRQALAAAGVRSGRSAEIAPHVTLWRDTRETPQRFVAPVGWRVEEFVLLAAIRGQGAHEVLGRWRLGG